MTSRVEDTATIVSQETNTVLTQVHRETADIGCMSGESPAEFAGLHGPFDDDDDDDDATQANTQNSQNITVPASQPLNQDGVDPSMGPPAAKKRKRMTFANKKLVAGRDSFVKPECSNQSVEDAVRVSVAGRL